MNLQELLVAQDHERIWDYYCGFLDLSIDAYMTIQYRLMEEQLLLWSESQLGQQILKGQKPKTIEAFRRLVPLTTYEDYSDMLLAKRGDTLPDKPVIWIQTTWEGGKHPVKLAPYTRSMLDVYRTNVTACLLLSTATQRGVFDVSHTDKILYALAPLPFATGLFPLALGEEISIGFLPPVKEAEQLTFSERNKLGFKLAMKKDVEFFFGLGSVAYAVSRSLSESSGKGNSLGALLKCHPKMITRLLVAKWRCARDKRAILPKDLFKLKGFMVAGTDNRYYKDDLEALWGVRPMELFAGTEPSIIGTETWSREGMYFFPDTCFYEFLHESDMMRLYREPDYKAPTVLMHEVIPGEKYELIISVLKGGAFMRYRVGDMYRCVGREHKGDGTRIPRFEYVDRVPHIIDIAGFTRISEHSIQAAVKHSGIGVRGWVACKSYNPMNKPYLQLYIELDRGDLHETPMNVSVIKDVLTTYFKYLDQDYRDLKKILGMEPLEVTILKCGSLSLYQRRYGEPISKMNPTRQALEALLNIHLMEVTERRI